MTEHLIIGLALVLVLGIAAQWAAWRLKLPAILLLLCVGIAAGPVTGLIKPDTLLGTTFFPIVSISVAIILFEGGLSLRIDELREIGMVVSNLITVGILITWIIASFFAWLLLGFTVPLAILQGAILIVTGPTVILPLLRQVRPSGQVGSILKWEGIVNDPIGAMMAILVFEVIIGSGVKSGFGVVLTVILKTLFFGGSTGILGASLLYILLKKHLIPDFLQNPMSLMIVVSVFALSNFFQNESGLLGVTVMGMALANQRPVKVKHIIEFKENLRVILLSFLFVILAARLKITDLEHVHAGSVLFLLILIVIVRPLMVYISTLRSQLSWKEKLFISGMAPRGIVAAAVSALFAYQLTARGLTRAELLVPYTFIVIIGTVIFYSIIAAPLARRLGLAKPVPFGVLILGAHEWGRKIGSTLTKLGFKVILTDTNRENIMLARLEGLETYYGNILAEYAINDINLDGIGHLIALTPNDEINSLAMIRFSEIFGRSEVYQLPVATERVHHEREIPDYLSGRILFDEKLNFQKLSALFQQGAELKTTNLTKEYTFNDYRRNQQGLSIPLFLITASDEIRIFSVDDPPEPVPGQKIVSLIVEKTEDSKDKGRKQ